MKNLPQDLRYGLRALVRYPGFSIIAIVALALGTGANTAIFSVVNAVLLRPLPYGDPDRIVLVWGTVPKSAVTQGPISPADYADFRDQNSVFEGIASYAYEDFNLSGTEEPERIQGTLVTANFFSVLGVKAPVGRVFSSDEDKPGAERVVVLSYGLWQRRFGADPNIVGKTITLNGGAFTVIGVTASDFQSPNKGDELWIPMALDGSDSLRIPQVIEAKELSNRARRFLTLIARLKPGVSLDQAQVDMSTIASRLVQQYPTTNPEHGVKIVPLHEQLVGDIRPALLTLLGAVGFVLLIACANVANLLLSRAASRQKEIAIRTAVGATRGRLISQLLTESILLALIGGALGLLLALVGIKLLIWLNPANVPRLSEISIDGPVLAFTLAVSLVTGIIFGLVPALQASKPDLNETLKEGGRGSTGGARRQFIRNMIVVLELALAQVLLIGAGLMIKSFYSLQNVDPGFNPESALTMQVALPSTKYPENDQIAAFYERVLKRIEVLPGVQHVGAVTTLPLTDSSIFFRFVIEGRAPASPDQQFRANFRAISYDYFRAMGIRLLKGRAFTEQDRDTSPPVIIINESMARRYWPDEDPMGKRISIPFIGGPPREIVGVVGDVKHAGLTADSGSEMYVPYLQSPWNFMCLVIRTASDPAQLAPAIRNEIFAVDNSQPVFDIKTLQQLVSDSISQPRLYVLLLSVFAGVALALAMVGIYGVMNYSVAQRTHEIGLRMALGAQQGNILRLIVGKGMQMAILGVIIGLGAAWPLTKYMSSQLYGVSATDPATYIAISLLLSLVAFLSSYIPARRATRVDPMVALRYE